MLQDLSFGSSLPNTGVAVSEAEQKKESTWHTCIGISRSLPEHVHRQGFVAMECTIMGADDLKDARNRSNL